MDKQLIDNLLKQSGNMETIPSKDIPDIDLYMDQVTTFISDRLKEYNRTPNDKILSKMMINNYIKDKLLPPPIKKKYSKSHVLLFIIIYHLKGCLTISDIAALLSPVAFKKNDKKAVLRLYDAFWNIQNAQKQQLASDFEYIDRLIAEHGKDFSERDQLALYAMALINEANERKLLAERIIDTMNKTAQ